MCHRFHRGFTAAEKAELWDRWKRGESLKAIGRAFGKPSSSIVRAETRPAIIMRMPDHAGAHRLQLDMATACEQIGLTVDRRGAVAPLPERPAAAAGRVDCAHIAPPPRLHGARPTLASPTTKSRCASIATPTSPSSSPLESSTNRLRSPGGTADISASSSTAPPAPSVRPIPVRGNPG
jgi:hypothetical protein